MSCVSPTPERGQRSCITISSTIVVPELQIQAHDYIINSEVNKYNVQFPPRLLSTCLPPGSFITMLFDEAYDLDYYKYLYAEVEDKLSWPEIVKRRLNVYPVSAKFMTLNDDTGRNLFTLEQDDFTMLDALLAYRQDATSVVLIDTTGAVSITDTTAGITIVRASLNELSTELSKLIFVYLDLEINKNTSNYSTDTTISTEDPLETVFELFVIDKYFDYMSGRNVDVRIGSAYGTPGQGDGGGGGGEECDPGPVVPTPSILDYPPDRC
jgi:hypothetical protein